MWTAFRWTCIVAMPFFDLIIWLSLKPVAKLLAQKYFSISGRRARACSLEWRRWENPSNIWQMTSKVFSRSLFWREVKNCFTSCAWCFHAHYRRSSPWVKYARQSKTVCLSWSQDYEVSAGGMWRWCSHNLISLTSIVDSRDIVFIFGE